MFILNRSLDVKCQKTSAAFKILNKEDVDTCIMVCFFFCKIKYRQNKALYVISVRITENLQNTRPLNVLYTCLL